ncbi:MAG: hypothetical protein RLN62_03335 [Rickettsiales bacterium]
MPKREQGFFGRLFSGFTQFLSYLNPVNWFSTPKEDKPKPVARDFNPERDNERRAKAYWGEKPVAAEEERSKPVAKQKTQPKKGSSKASSSRRPSISSRRGRSDADALRRMGAIHKDEMTSSEIRAEKARLEALKKEEARKAAAEKKRRTANRRTVKTKKDIATGPHAGAIRNSRIGGHSRVR